MAFNFNSYLINYQLSILDNMPPIQIDQRETDKKITYDKNLTRLDRLAGDIYEDETLWKIILWANPEYFCEFDIPDNTIIRVPWPKEDVITEVISKIANEKNVG